MKRSVVFFVLLLMYVGVKAQVYFSESFENPWVGNPPVPSEQWYQEGSGSKNWQRLMWNASGNTWQGGDYVLPAPSGAADGLCVAHLNTNAMSNGTNRALVTPVLNLSNATNPILRFKYFYNGSALPFQALRISGSIDGGSTWIEIGIIQGLNFTSWTQIVYNLQPFITGNVRLKFEAIATNSAADIWIDELVVENSSLMPLSGTYTIDNTLSTGGTNFNNFHDAINALNARGCSGNVVFKVRAGQEFPITSTLPPILVSTSAGQTITFQKDGTGENPFISSRPYIGQAFRISGTDNVIFDGINSSPGTYGFTSVFEIGGGARNIQIKNSRHVGKNTMTSTVFLKAINVSYLNRNLTNDRLRLENVEVEDFANFFYIAPPATSYSVHQKDSAVAIVNCVAKVIGNNQQNVAVFENQKDFVFQNNTIEIKSSTLDRVYDFSILYNYDRPSERVTIRNNVIKGTVVTSDVNSFGVNISCRKMIFENNTVYNIKNNFPGSSPTKSNTTGVSLISSSDSLIVRNNTIYDIETSKGSATGLILSAYNTTVVGNDNLIRNIITTAASKISEGIRLSTTTVNNYLYRNRIHDIKATNTSGVSYGMNFNATSSNFYVYNNIVSHVEGNLSAYSFYVTKGFVNLYYNTAYISYQAQNANTETANLYITYDATGTKVDAYNNIFINKTDVSLNGKFAAVLRTPSAQATALYNANNNVYYAGTPSSKNVILAEGTTLRQTIEDYKAYVTPKDLQSISGDVVFVNASTWPYDFHIKATQPTIVESAGVPISMVTTDIDNEMRNAQTPDIGADEGNFQQMDRTPPVITLTPLLNSSVVPRTLIVEVTDNVGVPNPPNSPVLYWRRKSSMGWGAWQLVEATSINGNQYTFVFGNGTEPFDSVQYFIVAQDVNSNVHSFPFGAQCTANPPRMTNPPARPLSYFVLMPISGVKTVGTGGDFTTLNAAANYLKNCELVGNLTLLLINNGAYNDGAVFENIFSLSPYYTLKIKPAEGKNITLKRLSGFNEAALIVFDSDFNFHLDGSNIENGSTRNLKIENYKNTNKDCHGVEIRKARKVIIENMEMVGDILYQLGFSSAIFVNARPVDTIVVKNNNIFKFREAIKVYGLTDRLIDYVNIQQNVFGDYSQNTLYQKCIELGNINKVEIHNNNIGVRMWGFLNSAQIGIQLKSKIIKSFIFNNLIHDVYNSSSTSSTVQISHGILYEITNTDGEHRIFNNFIWDIKGPGSVVTDNYSYIVGAITLGSGANYRIYHNTISLTGDVLGSVLNGVSTCIFVENGVSNVDIRNNIFINSQTGSAGGSNNTYGIISRAGASAFVQLNYNTYWIDGEGPFVGRINNTNYQTLQDWQNATNFDQNSFYFKPVFVSATDYHINSNNIQNCIINNKGINVGISTDYDNQPRSSTKPDIGADEWQGIVPTVINTIPEQNQVVPVSQVIEINFNTEVVKLNGQPLDASVVSVSPTFSFDFVATPTKIVLTPTQSLQNNTIYTVTVSNIKSTCDEPIAQPFTLSFRTVNNNALLANLKVNNVTVENFSPTVFSYTVVLPYGTTQIPVVSATPQDANATVNINQATQLPGSATVVVTAEDGSTTQTYTINFILKYRVTFTVTDGQNPINGAEISVQGHNPITTNSNGQAYIDLVNGTYTYSVTATGYYPLNNQQFVVEGADLNVPVTLTPLPPTVYLVTFVVTDGTNPIQGAVITIPNQNPLLTNTQGEAQIALPNGTYTYSVTATGYHPVSNQQFTVSGADLTVNVTLQPILYTVTFVVTDGQNPISGATISVSGQSPIYTNAQGQATIQLPNGSYSYSVTAPGYYPFNNGQFTVSNGDLTVPVVLTALPPDVYTVTFVVSSSGGGAIEGAQISIQGQQPIYTNAQGQAQIALPNGTYTYSVTATGYHPVSNQQFTVSGADLTVNVTLTPTTFVFDNSLGITIYPNPTDGVITIRVSGQKVAKVYDTRGIMLLQQTLDQQSQTIDLSHLAAGVYTLRIDNLTYKVIKK